LVQVSINKKSLNTKKQKGSKVFISFIIDVKNSDPQVTQTGANFFKNIDCVYEPQEVAQYINDPFSIGWLIGDKTKVEENVNLAIDALIEKLEKINKE
jgi:hypothetical protein